MADDTFGIIVEINPREALAGQAQIDRGFERNENSAREFEREAAAAMRAVAASAKQAAREQEQAARVAARAQSAAAKQAARDVEESARATIIAAERRAKASAAADREATRAAKVAANEQAAAAKAAADAAAAAAKRNAELQAQAGGVIADSYKVAARAGAEYRERLAQIVQLESRGAITAQQRTQAIAALQRETKVAADQQKQANAALAATYRQVVGPAAEYREKLNQIIQLERQGAITGKQRAQAIAGMQREMKQFSAQQQGGVRGAVSGALSSQFGTAALAGAGVGLAVTAAKGVVDLGDQYVTLSNQIRQATDSETEMGLVRDRLFASAARAKTSVQALTNVYASAALATRDLGTSQSDLLRLSELLSKATRGVSEANKGAGLQQFGQALTKGKLQAEELMSIMENIPKVGVLLAQGMGMTVGELRKAAEAGKVGTQQMLDAILKMGPEIDKAFAKSKGTSAESFQGLKDKLLQIVGKTAEQVNLNEGLAIVIDRIGEAIGAIGHVVNGIVVHWKSLDGLTGGFLGKLARAPSVLGLLAKGGDAIAGLWGASAAEIEEVNRRTLALIETTKKLAAETAAIYANVDKGFADLSNSITAQRAAEFRELLKQGKALDENLNERSASIIGLAQGKAFGILDANKAKADRDAVRRALGMPTDDEIAAAGKAYREKVVAAYRSLEDGAFGALKAERELAQAERDLDAAVRAGLVTRERSIQVLDLTRERLQGQIDPYAAIVEGLRAERAALSINADEQARYAEVRRVTMDLHRQGVDISDEQVEALHREIEATREATRMIEIKRGIIEGLRGEQERQAEQTRAADQLLASGVITADEYAKALGKSADAAAKLADSVKSASAGARGIEEQMLAEIKAAGVTMGVLGDVLTGKGLGAVASGLDLFVDAVNGAKVSFGDFARSVLADIEKIMLKMLVFQGLKMAFNLSMGPNGFGTVLAGALGVPGFAGGGTIIAGGRGGVDSVPINARVSPGERITFTPPGREAPGMQRAAAPTLNAVIVHDARAAALEALRSPEGATVIQATVMGMRGGFGR